MDGLFGRLSQGLFGGMPDVPAAPTYAQKLASMLRNVPYAIGQGMQGNSYGTADPTNAVNDLARQNWWRGSVMGAPEDVKQRNMQRALDIAMAAPTVYHGSPHRFDKFDSSKIGTGEGAQAYGHGLYFAESPAVAKEYAQSNKGRAAAKDGWLDELPVYKQMDVFNLLQKRLPKFELEARLAELQPRLGDDLVNKVRQIANSHNLYKVDLPDEAAARMLDWDKPLSQQPQNVLNNYDPRFLKMVRENYGNTGQSLYQAIQDLHSNAATASLKLKEAGIPGIRYLDGGSRGTGAGTSNYVVFPGGEDMLKILSRE
jgi:hypothetical protein